MPPVHTYNNVQELIEHLHTICREHPDLIITCHGWDDGTIVVTDLAHNELAYLEPAT